MAPRSHDTLASMTPEVDVTAPHSVSSSSVVQAILQRVIAAITKLAMDPWRKLTEAESARFKYVTDHWLSIAVTFYRYSRKIT